MSGGLNVGGINLRGNIDIWTGLAVQYGGDTLAARGIPAILASLSLTAQAASIVATNLLVAPPAGLYRITAYGEITQAATTSSSLIVTFGYTNAAAQTTSTNAVNTNVLGANTSQFGLQTSVIRVVSGNITYATTYASVGGTPMQYMLNVIVERLK